MKQNIPVLKEEEESPVPTAWRQTFIDIVEAFKRNDFQLDGLIDFVHTLAQNDAERIATNIAEYGDELVSLTEESWQSSIYLWVDGFWNVLIDLVTLDEGISDLVMFVKVRENDGKYCFKVEDVHVP